MTLFDGTGREAEAVITHVSRDAVTLSVGKVITVPESPGPQLVLAVAMPSAVRSARLIEQAVELGVTRLIPLTTARSVSPARGFGLEKSHDTIVTASRQCGRSRLMTVDSLMSWGSFIKSGLMGTGTIVAHPGGAPVHRALPEAVKAIKPDSGRSKKGRRASFVAVSGPDAGFTVEEISAVVTHGARLVDLGPRSLRSDTAALVMASLFMTNSVQD